METSNVILNFRSNHPKHQILNIGKNYIYRAINCTDKIRLNTIKKKQIYQNLIENFYPKLLFNKYWYSHPKNRIKTTNTCTNNNSLSPNVNNHNLTIINTIPNSTTVNNNRYHNLTYISKLSENIKKIFLSNMIIKTKLLAYIIIIN